MATLDSHTSEICQELDGQVKPMSEFEPGVTAPPFHVNCRSTTAPYFDDEFALGGERAARDSETGQTYYVPADMTYKEWSKAFTEGDKSGLQEVAGSGIIDKNVVNGAAAVHYVGKIDREIFSCISVDIATDEVIITDERIAHIKERHPGDYEKYYQCICSIVADPDYIIEANKPKSALLLKSFTFDNEKFKSVLRLVTSTDNPDFQNSVITFMKINEQEWNRLKKNKKNSLQA